MSKISYRLVIQKQGKDAQQARKALLKALATVAPAFHPTVRPPDTTLLVEITFTSDYDTPDLARYTGPALEQAVAAAGLGWVWGYAEGAAPPDPQP